MVTAMVTSCTNQKYKKVHTYVEHHRNSDGSDYLLYWYLMTSGNNNYYYYSSPTPVTSFSNVIWNETSSNPIVSNSDVTFTETEPISVESTDFSQQMQSEFTESNGFETFDGEAVESTSIDNDGNNVTSEESSGFDGGDSGGGE